MKMKGGAGIARRNDIGPLDISGTPHFPAKHGGTLGCIGRGGRVIGGLSVLIGSTLPAEGWRDRSAEIHAWSQPEFGLGCCLMSGRGHGLDGYDDPARLGDDGGERDDGGVFLRRALSGRGVSSSTSRARAPCRQPAPMVGPVRASSNPRRKV
jgi:hypothetical protein